MINRFHTGSLLASSILQEWKAGFYLQPLQVPHCQIYFAGKYTSVLCSTVQGALRSGVRAAQEVDEEATD